MSEILVINDNTVKVGEDNGSITELPLASLHFSNPVVGDKVRVYKDGDTFIVKREETVTVSIITNDGDRRKINKVAYIILTFFLGFLGVHRFMRGQVGLGVVMILFGWLTFGIWWLVDFIISLVKLSAYPGDDYVFTADGRFTK
ncbi:MAG TPA: TM2 domain-containing protein [Candidatus Microsaccharimonas sp.]|jgi:TM2 domain-containing membrane protein YozV